MLKTRACTHKCCARALSLDSDCDGIADSSDPAGRELSYNHPVRELTPISVWTGEAITLRLPPKDLKTRGGDYLMILLS